MAANLSINTSIFNKSVCIECPVDHCLLCRSLTECDQCNGTENYFLNATTLLCQPCSIEGCLNCSDLENCQVCDLNSSYSQEIGLTNCSFCNNSQAFFINEITESCEACSLLHCLNCSSLTECLECNETAQYFLNTTTSLCQPCSLEGCLACASLTQCSVCDSSNNYGFDNLNPSLCAQCNASCTCDGYYFPWTGTSCTATCGDGYIRLE